MEQMITTILENSVVAGGFVYVLHNLMGKFSTTLQKISDTLDNMNTRMELMDSRLVNLERKEDRKEAGE